ncbi:MAG: helix-turn-helix domain-containing protein [Chloroflexi bacterium]|nr:helix-turn-helix domain-containing protein [Chloroflexota bacterium]
MEDADLQQLGEMLREAREAQGLSLEEVEAQTRIRVKFLEALEDADLSLLPSALHAKGFLRSYAQFLRLDVRAIIAQFNAATGASPPPVTELTAEPAPPAEPLHRTGVAEPEPVEVESEVGEPAAEPAEEAEPTTEAATETLAADESATGDNGRRIRVIGARVQDPESLVPPPQIRRVKYISPEQWVGPAVPAALRKGAARGATPPPEDAYEPASAIAPPEGRPRPTGIPSRVLNSNLFIAAVLIVGLIVIVWWVTTYLSTVGGEDLAPGAAPDEALIATAITQEAITPSPTFRPTPTDGPASAPQILDRVVLSIEVVQTSWIYVEVDGEPTYEGQVVPGDVLNYEGSQEIHLKVGNAAGLVVNYNGQDLGPLGERGEIVERSFMVGGIVTPTPTPEPTSDGTSGPTVTPRATLTPTPSPTP